MRIMPASFQGRAQKAVQGAFNNEHAHPSLWRRSDPGERSGLAGDSNLGTVRSLDPAGRFVARRRWGWHHEAETLQKQDGALRGASPNELATFSLAILNVNVSARILQAAILELAVHVDAIVQNHVLILEDLVLMSVHRFTRAACRYEKFNASRRRKYGQGSRRWVYPLGAP